ncbi:Glycine--tRNA ligase 1, mitochondrial [Pichia californica]|nr:Glycine--tRNA ligase 1, mitochondrial [[Candida] californica]
MTTGVTYQIYSFASNEIKRNEALLVHTINKGYNMPRYQFNIITTPRIKNSVVKDLCVNPVDESIVIFLFANDNENESKDIDIYIDINESIDDGYKTKEKLLKMYPNGNINYSNYKIEYDLSVLKFLKNSNLCNELKLPNSNNEFAKKFLGMACLKPFKEDNKTIGSYELTGFISFYPGAGSQLLKQIEIFAKNSMDAKIIWITAIKEHLLNNMYTKKFGYKFINEELIPVSSDNVVNTDGTHLENDIGAIGDFHLEVFMKTLNTTTTNTFTTAAAFLSSSLLNKQNYYFYSTKSKSKSKSKSKAKTDKSLTLNKMTSNNNEFSREALESVLKRRFFFAPSFEIYGGVSGLYDYGPPGCALQANIIDAWRKHFVLEEDMLEVDCTMLTPHEVLKTSGHVDKFADWMCKDLKTGEIFRADHLVEEVIESRLKGDKEARGIVNEEPEEEDEQKKKRKKKVKEIKAIKLDDEIVNEYETILAKIDGFSGPELGEIIKKYNIVNPTTGDQLEQPVEFNLMFETAIGPSGQLKGYLRPETAQGQFLNFNKLLDFNNERMPFASASIGKSFRNEISPRSGLLRVREFLMAEIEHFVDPLNKIHSNFDSIKNLKISLLSKEVQSAGKTDILKISIGDAVSQGIIDNQTLGYFIGRIYLFLIKIGVNPEKLRFRQHMSNEMAHYAQDCWDAELQTSYGWIECVGCADRSAYDLSVHAAKTKEKLSVREALKEPETVELFECEIEKKKFGPLFRKDAPKVEEWLTSRNQKDLENLSKELETKLKITAKIPETTSETIEIPNELIKIEKKKKTIHVREYTPNVIEPSFGIGRIIYAIFEHSFWSRPEDSARAVLSFPPLVAPTKVLVVPLMNNKELQDATKNVKNKLRLAQIPFKVDDSGASIGKRYARNDELGTPFGITVDYDTIEDGSVTLRDRDSTNQVRGSLEDVIAAVENITYKGVSWKDGTSKLTPFESKSDE